MACLPTSSSAPPTSVVVGAGPAGLLSAVLLARHGHTVHLFEKRPSPLEADASDAERAFFIVLHPRGRAALLGAGLDLHRAAAAPRSGLQPVRAMGLGSGAALLRRRLAFEEPKLLGHRHAFVRAIVQEAEALQLPNLHFHWGTSFEGLDLAAQTATFAAAGAAGGGGSSRCGSCDSLSSAGGSDSSDSAGSGGSSSAASSRVQLKYDLLVAADGGWSRVRRAAAQQAAGQLRASVEPARMRYKVFRGLPPSAGCPFGTGAVTASSGSGSVRAGDTAGVDLCMLTPAIQPGIMFLSAASDGSGCVEGVLGLSSPEAWLPLQAVEDYAAFMGREFPALPAEWIPAIAAQLAAGSLAVAGMRADVSQMHVSPGGVVLLGDAAHGVTPRTGNGLNAALEDAAALGQLLGRHSLAALPAAYTRARLADSRAILWLDDTASARAGTTALGRLHPHALAQGCALLARAALGRATRGLVRPAAAVAMNESCLSYRAVAAQMRRDALLAATAGMLLTLLVAALAGLGAARDRLRLRLRRHA